MVAVLLRAQRRIPSATAPSCFVSCIQISAAIADVLKTKLKIDPSRVYIKVRSPILTNRKKI